MPRPSLPGGAAAFALCRPAAVPVVADPGTTVISFTIAMNTQSPSDRPHVLQIGSLLPALETWLRERYTVGVLDEDLRRACLEALKIARQDCLAFAGQHGWTHSAECFLGNIARSRHGDPWVAMASVRVVADPRR